MTAVLLQSTPKADILLEGSRRLRAAFIRNPRRFAGRDGSLPTGAIMIGSGFAFAACNLPEGRRAIVNTLIEGDYAGLASTVVRQSLTIYAATRITFQILEPPALDLLLSDPFISAFLLAHTAENQLRAERLGASLGRLDAHARICVLLLDIYDRLQTRGAASGGKFMLPLTQEQIADHVGLTLVHVNRTLRRLREEKLLLSGRRQIVILKDIERIRRMAEGLPNIGD